MTIDAAKTQKPSHPPPSFPAYMWLRFTNAPVAKTSVTWMTMKMRNQTNTKKCSDRAVWMLSTLLSRLNRVDNAGDIPSPASSASGAAMNTVMKHANCWRLL